MNTYHTRQLLSPLQQVGRVRVNREIVHSLQYAPTLCTKQVKTLRKIVAVAFGRIFTLKSKVGKL